jgi:predicted nucleic acid-binding protein
MVDIIISNTSPLLYLHRIEAMDWLPKLCEEVWMPRAVQQELSEGMRRGYDVPDPQHYEWLVVTDPRSVPSQWLNVDLGAGELAVLALALEHTECTVLLDDGHARRIGQAAGLNVWGTLRVLIEAKSHGLIERVVTHVDRLEAAGMWMSTAIRRRVLALAGENGPEAPSVGDP